MPGNEAGPPSGTPEPWGQPPWAETPAPAAAAPSPFSTAAPWEQAPDAPPRAASLGTAPLYDLRPLSTGEILDRTFSLYRKRFWLFAGLAVVASAVTTLSTFVQLTWGTVHKPAAVSARVDPLAIFKGPEFVVLTVTVLVTMVIYFFVYSLTQAATVHAVSEVYLGGDTTIRDSFEKVRAQWLRYVAIAFWQGWSYIWMPLALMVVGLPLIGFFAARGGTGPVIVGLLFFVLVGFGVLYGIYAYMRNSLGIVAAVVEGLTVKASLVRSKQLTHHRILRVLALFLLLLVLGLAAGVARAIPSFFLGLAFAASSTAGAVVLEGLTLITTFVTGALLLPVGAISFCLFYIDERVRREGFDVETLLWLGRPAALDAFGEPVQTAALPSPFSGSGFGGTGLG